jgi:transcriptional regulator GlxA family with amidase domain
MQRALAAAGTSFQRELGLFRVEYAKSLLTVSDASLTEIALEVGCSSLQHFSGLFRRFTGESPSAWRDRCSGARVGRP